MHVVYVSKTFCLTFDNISVFQSEMQVEIWEKIFLYHYKSHFHSPLSRMQQCNNKLDNLFWAQCLFSVKTGHTFLLPGFKVNQDGNLFTWSFLLFTSDLLGVPLSKTASGYPKIVSDTVFTKALCGNEDKLYNLLKLSRWYMINVKIVFQFELLSL